MKQKKKQVDELFGLNEQSSETVIKKVTWKGLGNSCPRLEDYFVKFL